MVGLALVTGADSAVMIGGGFVSIGVVVVPRR